MHNHFSQGLNLKKWILEKRPATIVECGAGDGELTKMIASLLDVYPFEFYVITDKPVQGFDGRIIWKYGLSYHLLTEFNYNSIGLCVIDTDHNFWTLMKELEALEERITNGGLIAMHDVDTFYHDTGMALSYSSGEPYPRKEIEKMACYGGLGDALIEFLRVKNLSYRLISFTNESHGAALIQKRPQSNFSIVTPGAKPVYAQKTSDIKGDKHAVL